MNAHDEMLDNVAVYAMGMLPPEEARAVREHLRTCPQCLAEYRALAPAVQALAYSAQACPDAESAAGSVAPPGEMLKKRIMRQIRPNVGEMRAVRPIVWPAYLVAAACFAMAVFTGIIDTSLQSQLRTTTAQLKQVSEHNQNVTMQLAYQRSALDALVAPDSVHYPVKDGEVVKHSGRIYLAMNSLPAPPRGKVYQAWTLHQGAKFMSPSVTFIPTKTGVAVVPISVNANGIVAVAVSVEPEGGSKQPTSTPTFVLKLN